MWEFKLSKGRLLNRDTSSSIMQMPGKRLPLWPLLAKWTLHFSFKLAESYWMGIMNILANSSNSVESMAKLRLLMFADKHSYCYSFMIDDMARFLAEYMVLYYY